jgi:cysteinyl-tRNA synthetase
MSIVQVLDGRTGTKKVLELPTNGQPLRWYTCGPTVYDSAHLGHARCYLGTDVIRRILVDYLHVNTVFAQNITNCEDKTIFRARRNRTVILYVSSAPHEQVVRDTTDAITWALTQLQKLVDAGDSDARTKIDAMLLLQTRANEAKADKEALVVVCRDVLGEWLEHKANERGEPLPEFPNEVFQAHADHYEREFSEDMRALHVRPPDVVTRVTEYVPKIVAYIERILANGFAYPLDSSVYFDTQAFRAAGFDPCKMAPASANDPQSSTPDERGRKSPTDFVLWKARKPGEPFWSSPWGDGRPGWHIEVRRGKTLTNAPCDIAYVCGILLCCNVVLCNGE